jgi:hypothetical protein
VILRESWKPLAFRRRKGSCNVVECDTTGWNAYALRATRCGLPAEGGGLTWVESTSSPLFRSRPGVKAKERKNERQKTGRWEFKQ